MRSAFGVLALAGASLAILAGCPSTYGFRGRVVTAKDAIVHVIAVEPTPEPGLTDVVPVANARITCDGCGDEPIQVDANGRFGVSLGTSYSAAKPIVLHVSAPGFATMDVDIARPPHDSQLGYGLLVVVLKRQQ
jgi:hypothetical protein